jgi:mono/diheme cytochrome c family protein
VFTVVGVLIAIALILILGWLLGYATRVVRPHEPGAPITGMLAMERKVSITLTMLIGTGLFFTGYALLFEPARMAAARERQQRDSIERGIITFTTLCYPCHGADGKGAVVPGDPDKRVAPALNRPDFQVATSPDLDEQRRVYTLINNTIHRGRPGTPMPAWGRLDGGTLLDEQIHELTLMIMNGHRRMVGQVEEQPVPGVHEYKDVEGTPWDIVQEQLNVRFAEGAPTPIPASSLLGQDQGPGAKGKAVMVKYGCNSCHTIQGVSGFAGKTGPELTHIGTEAATMKPGMDAEAYIRESIREPTAFVVPGFQPVMPKLPLSDEELNDVVQYLLTLK